MEDQEILLGGSELNLLKIVKSGDRFTKPLRGLYLRDFALGVWLPLASEDYWRSL